MESPPLLTADEVAGRNAGVVEVDLAQLDAAVPELADRARHVAPWRAAPTASRLMPRRGGEAAASVTASTSSGSACAAWVIIVFVPDTT